MTTRESRLRPLGVDPINGGRGATPGRGTSFSRRAANFDERVPSSLAREDPEGVAGLPWRLIAGIGFGQ